VDAQDLLQATSWERYWPSRGLEKRLFLDGWLKNREAEGRKSIDPADALMTRPGEPTRLRIILSTGIKTPTGVISTARTTRLRLMTSTIQRMMAMAPWKRPR
jgi:hypothetical protein